MYTKIKVNCIVLYCIVGSIGSITHKPVFNYIFFSILLSALLRKGVAIVLCRRHLQTYWFRFVDFCIPFLTIFSFSFFSCLHQVTRVLQQLLLKRWKRMQPTLNAMIYIQSFRYAFNIFIKFIIISVRFYICFIHISCEYWRRKVTQSTLLALTLLIGKSGAPLETKHKKWKIHTAGWNDAYHIIHYKLH